jgi:hypothetical protein
VQKKHSAKKLFAECQKKHSAMLSVFFYFAECPKKTLGKEPDSGSDCDLYSQFMRICLFYWLVFKKNVCWMLCGQ